MNALDRQMREQLSELARTIGSLAGRRRERLRAVTFVTADESIVVNGVVLLRAMLARRGLSEVEVRAVLADGPLRLLSLEFDPDDPALAG